MAGTVFNATELIATLCRQPFVLPVSISSHAEVFAGFEELDLRLANDPRLAHSLAQCGRGHEFARLIDQPRLQLVQPVDDAVYRRYEYAAIDLHKNPYQAPHMVVRFGDTVFTTVMVFLRRS